MYRSRALNYVLVRAPTGFSEQRRIYHYVRHHWHGWFPALPSYQAFNRRLNGLGAAFEQLLSLALEPPVIQLAPMAERLVDSLPVMLAKGGRSQAARVAPEVADKGYCASKSTYYYGVKRHAIALRRTKQLPLPALLHLSRASQHDLSALRELNPHLGQCYLFGDKAYAGDDTRRVFALGGTHLVTPYKRRRNEPETLAPTLSVTLRLQRPATIGESVRLVD